MGREFRHVFLGSLVVSSLGLGAGRQYSNYHDYRPSTRATVYESRQLNNPSASLVACSNGGGICRLDRSSFPAERKIHFLNDGTFVVWGAQGWEAIEPTLGQDLDRRYPESHPAIPVTVRKNISAKYRGRATPPPSPIAVRPPSPLHVNLPPSPPQPRPRPPEPVSPRVRPSQHQLPAKWFTQRHQGDAGTCHAFALAPTTDALENRDQPYGGFQTSENWMVFLSVLDRLCNPADQVVHTASGYYASSTMARLRNIGYCSTKNYNDYNPSLLTDERMKEKIVIPKDDALDRQVKDPNFFRKLLETDEKASDVLRTDTDVLLKGFIEPQHEDKFRAAFGISSANATRIFCNLSPNATADKLLRDLDVDASFRSCLTEALGKRQKLAACQVRRLDSGTDGEKKERIRAAVYRDIPVVIAIKNYQDNGPAMHTNHAISITGYDDAKGVFKVMNSWGEGNNYDIPYAKIKDIYAISYLDCGEQPRPSAASDGVAFR